MYLQQQVEDLVKEGKNVFFTGNAGTGNIRAKHHCAPCLDTVTILSTSELARYEALTLLSVPVSGVFCSSTIMHSM